MLKYVTSEVAASRRWSRLPQEYILRDSLQLRPLDCIMHTKHKNSFQTNESKNVFSLAFISYTGTVHPPPLSTVPSFYLTEPIFLFHRF
jgi:hypothetical protein